MRRWVVRLVVGFLVVISLAILAFGLHIVPPIAGRVTDAVTGAPIAGVQVALEVERYEASTHVDAHPVAVTGDSGRFWLGPFVAWAIMGIGDSWVIVNHAPDSSDAFSPAETEVLYHPLTRRTGGPVSPASYFPVTLSFTGRCDPTTYWEPTCINTRWWSFRSIPLVPMLDDVEGCTKIGDSTLPARCRELNLYRSAFLRVGPFDDAQRAGRLCDQVTDRRVSQTCRTQVASYAADRQHSDQTSWLTNAEPRLRVLFARTIAGTAMQRASCDPSDHFRGHLQCKAEYSEDSTSPLVTVTFEEWVDRDEPPADTLQMLRQPPHFTDNAARTRAWRESRREGTIRRYRGVEISAADWVSQNRYLRVFFHERTRLQEAFGQHFLAQYPSTLR